MGIIFQKSFFQVFLWEFLRFSAAFFALRGKKRAQKKHKKRPAQKRVIFSKKLISERAVQLPEVSAADGKLLWCSLLR